MRVRKPHGCPFVAVLLTVKVGVDEGLCPVERITCDSVETRDRFDLLDQETAILDENAIDPPLEFETKLDGVDRVGDTNLRLVARGSRSLQLLVHPGAFEGAIRPGKLPTPPQVPCAQDEFNEIANGYGNRPFAGNRRWRQKLVGQATGNYTAERADSMRNL